MSRRPSAYGKLAEGRVSTRSPVWIGALFPFVHHKGSCVVILEVQKGDTGSHLALSQPRPHILHILSER
eukprot:scaffold389783_cov19-Prasinocladus_malaysianus.AAC.1